MQQRQLFGTPARMLVRRTDPDTSKAAAESVDTTKLEREVFEVIRRFPDGATQDMLLDAFPADRSQSITPRCKSLIAKGLVMDTGERRIGRCGRPQRVLRACL
jgi:hypothetical protein